MPPRDRAGRHGYRFQVAQIFAQHLENGQRLHELAFEKPHECSLLARLHPIVCRGQGLALSTRRSKLRWANSDGRAEQPSATQTGASDRTTSNHPGACPCNLLAVDELRLRSVNRARPRANSNNTTQHGFASHQHRHHRNELQRVKEGPGAIWPYHLVQLRIRQFGPRRQQSKHKSTHAHNRHTLLSA